MFSYVLHKQMFSQYKYLAVNSDNILLKVLVLKYYFIITFIQFIYIF